MLCSTARVILQQVVYGWRNQRVLVGQDFALQTTRHRQVTTNFPKCSAQAEPATSEAEGKHSKGYTTESPLLANKSSTESKCSNSYLHV